MKRISHNFRSKGKSLVEVVVAFGVVIVIVTGLLSATIMSVNATRIGKMRTKAIKYAQDGLELSRSLRDNNVWPVFQADYSGGTTLTWCVDNISTWPAISGACSVPNIDSIFTRNVTFTWDSVNEQMDVKSSVTWQEGTTTKTSEFTTTLTQWK